MKLLRVELDGGARIAAERGRRLLDVTPLLPRRRPEMKALIEAGPRALARLARALETGAPALEEIPRRHARPLAPFRNPEKIIGIGRNYLDHCREQNAQPPARPMLFAMFPNALLDPGAPIPLPPETAELDYEGELAVILGAGGRRIPEERALEYVFGYSILNDISARDLQAADGQWVRAKSSDGFAPFGPAILTADEVPDPQGLAIRTWLNGEVVQDSTTREMIFSVARLIAFASGTITLAPGDLLSTGTPAGVGKHRKPPRLLRPGDRVRVEIPPIGALENPVEAEIL